MSFKTHDNLGYIYTVEVAGRSIRLVEFLPSDENPFILEAFKFTPQEYIKVFDLADAELVAFREMMQKISMEIARMRNA